MPDETHDELEEAVDRVIEASGGDLRHAIRALIAFTDNLEEELAKVSYGYARGRMAERGAG